MSSRVIFHVDMDAFYTSIEQRDHPELRGKPVVVGADPRQGMGRGVVAAASYEARQFGVRSAMPITQAYRRLPEGVYLPGRMSYYVEVSKNLMDIFRSYTDLVEPLSIDEAFLDMSVLCRPDSAQPLAEELKVNIWRREQLRASVGVAPNKFLAKIASDLDKPDGLVQVRPGEEVSFLDELPIEKLWGVGPKTAERLRKLGLTRISQLRERSPELLGLGKHGDHLNRLARGLDDRPVVVGREPKSVGHERTFERDIDDDHKLEQTLRDLCEKVAARLRRHKVVGRTVTLKFRDEHFVTKTRSRSVRGKTGTGAIDDGARLYAIALELLKGIDRKGSKVRLIGVSVGKLSSVDLLPAQMTLFGIRAESPVHSRRTEKKRQLNQAVDALEDRFGDRSVTPASLLEKE